MDLIIKNFVTDNAHYSRKCLQWVAANPTVLSARIITDREMGPKTTVEDNFITNESCHTH